MVPGIDSIAQRLDCLVRAAKKLLRRNSRHTSKQQAEGYDKNKSQIPNTQIKCTNISHFNSPVPAIG
jgi:hypothetical protein